MAPPEDDEVAPAVVPQAAARFRRESGADLSRVLALSDGVFAFAMTLLVLGFLPVAGLDSGQLVAYLGTGRFKASLAAFALGFFVAGYYWTSHDALFSFVWRADRFLRELNLLVLVLVVLVPFATIVLDDASGTFYGVATYATIQALTGFSLLGIWLYASRGRRLVHPDLPQGWISFLTFRLLLAPTVFLASIGIAAVSPIAAELSWGGILVLLVAYRSEIRGRRFIEPET